MSTRTFYEEFDDLRECFLAVLDLGLERAGELIAQAIRARGALAGRGAGRAGVAAVFFDSEPALTRVWFVEALAAGSWALAASRTDRREAEVDDRRVLGGTGR